MTTLHLWVLNFYLWIIEYIVVVVDILNDFYRLLVLRLLFGL